MTMEWNKRDNYDNHQGFLADQQKKWNGRRENEEGVLNLKGFYKV